MQICIYETAAGAGSRELYKKYPTLGQDFFNIRHKRVELEKSRGR
jgi:hypothetical protein